MKCRRDEIGVGGFPENTETVSVVFNGYAEVKEVDGRATCFDFLIFVIISNGEREHF
jgi:hypothetical protein